MNADEGPRSATGDERVDVQPATVPVPERSQKWHEDRALGAQQDA